MIGLRQKREMLFKNNGLIVRKIQDFCKKYFAGIEKRLYLCIVSFHHASHLNSEPGWNFCYKIMQYNKQPISVADQIAQLKSRGLTIEDEANAEKTLSVISYFRFANYLRPMEEDKVSHTFKRGKKIQQCCRFILFRQEIARCDILGYPDGRDCIEDKHHSELLDEARAVLVYGLQPIQERHQKVHRLPHQDIE